MSTLNCGERFEFSVGILSNKLKNYYCRLKKRYCFGCRTLDRFSLTNCDRNDSVKNTFKAVGFTRAIALDDLKQSQSHLIDAQCSRAENKRIEEQDRVLKHVLISGKTVSTNDFVVRSITHK